MSEDSSDQSIPKRAQVVIVGGGIVGASTAYHLARRGWSDVLLLEQNSLTSGTTWHAAGLVTQARETWGTREIVQRSLEVFRSLEQDTGFSTGFVETGTINLATSPERRIEFDFRDSVLLHMGIEKPIGDEGWGPKMLRNFTKQTSVRAGYVFDRSPVVDKSVGPLFPDANRHSLTLGMTKTLGNKDLSLFYQMMQFINRTVDVPANQYQGTNGEYRNFAHLIGMSMRLRPGRK